ncbi:hypothetical protein [Actinoplanes sp. NPDC049265]|uniref:hypothetical protein n=1 Tax=Actinoplanes sp. NPDC049265 TaxID=3363902 RepID=UPI0037222DDB
MAMLLGAVEATLPPEDNMVLVAGTGFRDFVLPDFTAGRLCYGGPDQLYLMGDGRTGHDEHVLLESWDAEPAPDAAELTDVAVVTLTRPGVYVSWMAESAASPVLELAVAGDYRARVTVTGRAALAELPLAVPPGRRRPVEHVRVQLWPQPASSPARSAPATA